jgi:putative aldouronate transport system substrate-binding protein
MTTHEFDRRRFLAAAAGASGLAATLAACGGGNSDTGSIGGTGASTAASGSTSAASGPSSSAGATAASSSGASTIVPAYVPYTGVKPDLPAGDHNVPAGFYHYPANPPAFITGPVGNGDSLTFMMEGNVPATPEGSNPWWQALEKAWNVKYTFNNVLSGSYLPKLQTTIAGGDLADFTQIPNGGVPGSGLPDLPQVLEKMFTDLTPFLAGDAIKDYPGLASIPTDTWTKICTINGKIWGIAQPRPSAAPIANYRKSVFDAAGVSAELSDGKDFVALFKGLTDVRGGRYAMAQIPTDWLLPLVLQMMEAPNGWAVTNGKFTSWYESDQMADALSELAKLWAAGYINPDSFSGSGWTAKWLGGNLGVYSGHFPQWTSFAKDLPDDTVGVLRLPKWSGGGPAPQYLDVPGYADPVGFKKTTDDKRITEQLRIANYIAAPFGTKEYLLVNNGVAGNNYTLDGADPASVKANAGQGGVSATYMGGQGSSVLYANGMKQIITDEHKFLSDVMPTGVSDPSLGLYSATNASKGAAARKKVHAVQDDVIQGRKSVSDFKAAVASWKKDVGDQIAKEYAEAYAKSH